MQTFDLKSSHSFTKFTLFIDWESATVHMANKSLRRCQRFLKRDATLIEIKSLEKKGPNSARENDGDETIIL